MNSTDKTPTAEQRAIIELPPEAGLTAVIDAVAGSGKTSIPLLFGATPTFLSGFFLNGQAAWLYASE